MSSVQGYTCSFAFEPFEIHVSSSKDDYLGLSLKHLSESEQFRFGVAFQLRKPWQYKNLNAGAASWTELKHDTILYAEQSEAEMGEGSYFEIPPYVPPETKGYVEPNPLFFRQLGASIDQMVDQMKRAGFITEEYLDKFILFRDLAHKAEVIAQKEVSGDTITREDYQWIQNLRESFDRPLLLPRGADEIKDPADLQMALIADVATDAVEGRVLEVGTGLPQRIVVVVKECVRRHAPRGSAHSVYQILLPAQPSRARPDRRQRR